MSKVKKTKMKTITTNPDLAFLKAYTLGAFDQLRNGDVIDSEISYDFYFKVKNKRIEFHCTCTVGYELTFAGNYDYPPEHESIDLDELIGSLQLGYKRSELAKLVEAGYKWLTEQKYQD